MAMINKQIWKFEDHNERVDMCYTKESMRHPAKMQLQLCREIIKAYSKPGDLILDPMCGVGTTIVEGMLLNRNVIGIEYEQKFVDMAQGNIDKINSLWKFAKHGQGQVIKGDSRELVKLLKAAPGLGMFLSRNSLSWNGCTAAKGGENAIRPGADKEGYGTNPENIGNMKYGQVDTIVTSPPFANQNEGGGLNRRKKDGKLTKQDIRMGNCITTLSDDKNNIDNVKNYGQIDLIATSPPFEDSLHKVNEKFAHNHPTRGPNNFGVYENAQYSDDPANCRNLQGKTYLNQMLLIYRQCYLVLKGGGLYGACH